MLKKTIKNIVYSLAAKFGSHTQTHKAPQLVILMYHRILPLDSTQAKLEEPGMVVSPDSFKMHLELLKPLFEFTTLEDWLYKKNNNLPLPSKSCVVSFDDGWQDNYQYAFPLLKQFKLPANIFLVSDMIGSSDTFWPEKLSKLLSFIIKQNVKLEGNEQHQWLLSLAPELNSDNNITANHEFYSKVIQGAKQYTDSRLHQLIDESSALLNCHDINNDTPSLLSWQQVIEMQSSGLITFGSHTCDHSRLNDELDIEQIKHQVSMSKQNIESRLDAPVTSFCYPNGDTNDDAVEQVKKHYALAVTTKSGWNDTSSDPYLLKRISIHQGNASTKNEFFAQLSGWLK